MLKIPSIGSYTFVWTLENTAHTKSALEDGLWLYIIVEGGILKNTPHIHNLSPHKRAMQKMKISFSVHGVHTKNPFKIHKLFSNL